WFLRARCRTRRIHRRPGIPRSLGLAGVALHRRRETKSRAPRKAGRPRVSPRGDRERRQVHLQQCRAGCQPAADCQSALPIMRITIDATSALLRSAGIKSYTYHWLRHLRQAAQPNEEIRAFPYLRDFATLDHEHSALPPTATWPRIALVHAANVFGSAVL